MDIWYLCCSFPDQVWIDSKLLACSFCQLALAFLFDSLLVLVHDTGISFQEEWIPRSHLSFSLDCYGFVQSHLELCLIGHSAQSVGMMWVACHDMSAFESQICLWLTYQKCLIDFILIWFYLSNRCRTWIAVLQLKFFDMDRMDGIVLYGHGIVVL